jgi:biotin operon repressor
MTDLDQTVYSSAQPLPPEGSLFDSFACKVLRRVDDVIAGRRCQWAPTPAQGLLLRLLRPHQGKRRAVPLETVRERMHLSARTVKELVQDLRTNFGVQLGASRDAEGGGYYLVATEAESDESTAQMRAQAITMLRASHRMRRDRETLSELLQQIELELKEVA